LDDLGYSNTDLGERLLNWLAGTWPFLVKRYIEFDIAIHVHLEARTRQKRETGQFCTVFERAKVEADHIEPLSCGRRFQFDGGLPRDGDDQVQKPVLVRVGQLVQPPERIILRASIPSVVRLLILDQCLVYGGEAPDLFGKCRPSVSVSGSSELQPVIEDRKLGALCGRPSVELSQFAREVVEATPQVVEELPNKHTARWRRSSAHDCLDNQVTRLRVNIVNNTVSVSFEEPIDLLLKSIHVLPCPLVFEPNTVGRVG
jgi:hypothetical protein